MPGTMYTGEDVDRFRFETILSAVRMQAETGMRASRINALAAARSAYGCKGRTAKAILAELEAMREEKGRPVGERF